ncbi:hypothetical protein WJX72_011526 [[Myrmecia] bisecta]|uniref:U-box domain-containing protein n=1 Tax=[Myrmecia] bisecta TaxID=41462 RepID=A0AAW1RAR5_9CHLO
MLRCLKLRSLLLCWTPVWVKGVLVDDSGVNAALRTALFRLVEYAGERTCPTEVPAGLTAQQAALDHTWLVIVRLPQGGYFWSPWAGQHAATQLVFSVLVCFLRLLTRLDMHPDRGNGKLRCALSVEAAVRCLELALQEEAAAPIDQRLNDPHSPVMLAMRLLWITTTDVAGLLAQSHVAALSRSCSNAAELAEIAEMLAHLQAMCEAGGKPAYQDLAKLNWALSKERLEGIVACSADKPERREQAAALTESLNALKRGLSVHTAYRSAQDADAAFAALMLEEEAEAGHRAQQVAKAAAKRAKKQRVKLKAQESAATGTSLRLPLAAQLRALCDAGRASQRTCPIKQEVMKDPVVCSNGHTYERSAIAAWPALHDTLPMTNQPLASKALIANVAVRQVVASFLQQSKRGLSSC